MINFFGSHITDQNILPGIATITMESNGGFMEFKHDRYPDSSLLITKNILTLNGDPKYVALVLASCLMYYFKSGETNCVNINNFFEVDRIELKFTSKEFDTEQYNNFKNEFNRVWKLTLLLG